jgi:nucleoside-diphosphate-sugar epimerase
MSLIGKNIICVGGNGFIGNYFASRLVQNKANVSILSRLVYNLYQKRTKTRLSRKQIGKLAYWRYLLTLKILKKIE